MNSLAPVLVGLTAGAMLLSVAATAADIPAEDRRSGYDFMTRELKAMQDDEAANPGMLAFLDGEAIWQRSEGAGGKSCATCHGDASTSRSHRCLLNIRTCWHWPLTWRISRKDNQCPSPTMREVVPLSKRAGKSSSFDRASSTFPARNATMTTGAAVWEARQYRKRIRPAILSIGWNGRRSARCVAACATA